MSDRTLRTRVFDALEGERKAPGGRGFSACDIFLLVLILANGVALALESVPSIAQVHGRAFRIFDVASVAIFTVEYALRLWASPEDPRYPLDNDWRSRAKYAVTPLAIFDLLAILPFYLAFLIPFDLRILRLFRLLRILKLTRYSLALATMVNVIRVQRNAVLGALCVLAVLVVVSSALLYLLEHEAQPVAFGSIPAAMWWSVSTLTTVGYGDVVPVTTGGRVVGSIVMVLGIGVFVMWTSIFAAGFIEESRKRNFVVNWNLVAKVPAFSRLDAQRIADITRLLKPEIVPPRFTVMRRGEMADCMYFVISGELEVDLPTRVANIHEGHFFGEMALLDDRPRRATVTALTECHLLRLERADFERLMAAEPALHDAIRQISRERFGRPDAAEL